MLLPTFNSCGFLLFLSNCFFMAVRCSLYLKMKVCRVGLDIYRVQKLYVTSLVMWTCWNDLGLNLYMLQQLLVTQGQMISQLAKLSNGLSSNEWGITRELDKKPSLHCSSIYIIYMQSMLQQYVYLMSIHQASTSCPITYPHVFSLRPLCFLYMP